MLLLAPLIVIMLAVAVRIALPWLRRARVHRELRRDWWTGFEREFRAYASRSWEAARQAERRS
jgi:quinol-cytochrome oxidoreductase complex cytochrome b subunit